MAKHEFEFNNGYLLKVFDSAGNEKESTTTKMRVTAEDYDLIFVVNTRKPLYVTVFIVDEYKYDGKEYYLGIYDEYYDEKWCIGNCIRYNHVIDSIKEELFK